MLRTATALIFACCLATEVSAQADAFHYRAENAPAPGTVWRWTKSNLDGSQPWVLELYVASPTRIDVIKWVEGGSDFVEVAADIDPARGMPVNLQQWNTSKDGRQPRVWGNVGAEQLTIQLAGGPRFDIPHGGQPLHMWGFDLMGLAFLLPHLKHPEQAFELAIIDPNRPGPEGQGFAQGSARFEPVGEERIDGRDARKYRISGAVFGEAEGWIWVDRGNGRLLRAEHPVPTSTDWQDWRLEAGDVAQMDGNQWEQHKLELAAAIRDAAGIAQR